MISPRGRLVPIILLLSSSAVVSTLSLLYSEPQTPRPTPPRPPNAQASPKPDLRQDPSNRSPRNIRAGEVHLYQFNLKPGEFVLFVVEQEGVDLVAEVLDQAGELLFKVDGLNRDRGPEPVPLLAETGSSFDVRVSSGRRGTYRVRIERRRQAIPADRAWFEGARAYWRGRDLVARRGPAGQIEKSFRDAAREWERAGHAAGQADALYKLGELYKGHQRNEEALAVFTESLPLFEKAGNRRQEVMVRNYVCAISKDRNGREAAETCLRETLKITEESPVPDAKAKTLINLAHILKEKGDFSGALDLFLQALDLL